MNCKFRCVVNSEGYFKSYVLVFLETDTEDKATERVESRSFQEGDILLDTDPPDELARPRWNFDSQTWTESATPEEITAWEFEHPAPPPPSPSTDQRIADLEDAYTADKFGGGV